GGPRRGVLGVGAVGDVGEVGAVGIDDVDVPVIAREGDLRPVRRPRRRPVEIRRAAHQRLAGAVGVHLEYVEVAGSAAGGGEQDLAAVRGPARGDVGGGVGGAVRL